MYVYVWECRCTLKICVRSLPSVKGCRHRVYPIGKARVLLYVCVARVKRFSSMYLYPGKSCFDYRSFGTASTYRFVCLRSAQVFWETREFSFRSFRSFGFFFFFSFLLSFCCFFSVFFFSLCALVRFPLFVGSLEIIGGWKGKTKWNGIRGNGIVRYYFCSTCLSDWSMLSSSRFSLPVLYVFRIRTARCIVRFSHLHFFFSFIVLYKCTNIYFISNIAECSVIAMTLYDLTTVICFVHLWLRDNIDRYSLWHMIL